MMTKRDAYGMSAAVLTLQAALGFMLYLWPMRDYGKMLLILSFVGTLMSIIFVLARMAPSPKMLWVMSVGGVVMYFVFETDRVGLPLWLLFGFATFLAVIVNACDAYDLVVEDGKREFFWPNFAKLTVPQFCILAAAAILHF